MNLPSDDQSLMPTKSDDFSRRSSVPPPVAVFWYRFEGPARFEPNTRRAPSGDHNGPQFQPGPTVNRDRTPLVMSVTQIFPIWVTGSMISSATFLSSGERARLYWSAGGPTAPSGKRWTGVAAFVSCIPLMQP